MNLVTLVGENWIVFHLSCQTEIQKQRNGNTICGKLMEIESGMQGIKVLFDVSLRSAHRVSFLHNSVFYSVQMMR